MLVTIAPPNLILYKLETLGCSVSSTTMSPSLDPMTDEHTNTKLTPQEKIQGMSTAS